jgi:hypothetical protein
MESVKYSELWGINILEESITDFNLLDLQINHPLEIVTQKFSKPREAREGADWEWWLGSQGFWLGLRVQAKILSPQKLRYLELNHSTIHGRQIELLINHSFKNKYPKVPVYVFYNYWEVNKFDPPWLCPSYSKFVEMLGCGVSEATLVKSILDKGSDRLTDIASIMFPWSCLVCCRGFSEKDDRLPFRAYAFLMGAFRKYIKEKDLPPYERNKFVLKEAPDYVYRILEGQRISEEEWQKIGVNRITVTQEKR